MIKFPFARELMRLSATRVASSPSRSPSPALRRLVPNHSQYVFFVNPVISFSLRGQFRCYAQRELPPGMTKFIERGDLDIQFARSSGAGGQNVNKVRTTVGFFFCKQPRGEDALTHTMTHARRILQVNTKADVRLNLTMTWFLTEEVKEAIRIREKNRVNNKDELVVASQEHRTQHQNLDEAIEKINTIVLDCAESIIVKECSDEKKKKIKGLKKAYNEKRLDSKKKDGQKKKDRKMPRGGWD